MTRIAGDRGSSRARESGGNWNPDFALVAAPAFGCGKGCVLEMGCDA